MQRSMRCNLARATPPGTVHLCRWRSPVSTNGRIRGWRSPRPIRNWLSVCICRTVPGLPRAVPAISGMTPNVIRAISDSVPMQQMTVIFILSLFSPATRRRGAIPARFVARRGALRLHTGTRGNRTGAPRRLVAARAGRTSSGGGIRPGPPFRSGAARTGRDRRRNVGCPCTGGRQSAADCAHLAAPSEQHGYLSAWPLIVRHQ
jgi:hypothetical protein